MYTRGEAPRSVTLEDLTTGFTPWFQFASRDFPGNDQMGYKMTLCARDISIYAAIFIGAPALGALKKDGIHLVFQYTEALPEGSPLDMYFSKTDFIAGNADLLKRFRAAMTEASEFANANPDKVRDYVR